MAMLRGAGGEFSLPERSPGVVGCYHYVPRTRIKSGKYAPPNAGDNKEISMQASTLRAVERAGADAARGNRA